ncbi:MAG: DUF6812 domain-containing protein [Chloroflexota bacterium]
MRSERGRLEEGSATGEKRLRYCFVTESRWVLGTVRLDHSDLHSLLNTIAGGTLMAEDVVLQSDVYAYRSGEQAEYASIKPERVLFVMPVDEQAAAAEDDDRPGGNQPCKEVRIGVGRYEILGTVHLHPGGNLNTVLVGADERFLAVRRAVVRRVDAPGLLERREVVLVNRERIDYVLPAPPLPLFPADYAQGLLD